MSKQFEQFELLYKQVLNTSNEIKHLIDIRNFDEVVARETHKSRLVSNISVIKPTLKLSDEENSQIEELKTKILTQEKENLERLQVMRNETLFEIKKENEREKFANKYEFTEAETGSICDYTSD